VVIISGEKIGGCEDLPGYVSSNFDNGGGGKRVSRTQDLKREPRVQDIGPMTTVEPPETARTGGWFAVQSRGSQALPRATHDGATDASMPRLKFFSAS
jgi:hypothetical protein